MALSLPYPKANYILLLLSLTLFGAAFFLERKISLQAGEYTRLTQRAQSYVLKEESRAAAFLDSLAAALNKSALPVWGIADSLYKKSNILPAEFTYFIYKENQLVYWSENNVLIQPAHARKLNNRQLVFLNNGWYLYLSSQSNRFSIAGLLLIKRSFPFQNKYLDNRFNPRLKLPSGAGLLADKNKSPWVINNASGAFLFGVNYGSEMASSDYEIPLAILFFSAIILLIIFLYSFEKYLLSIKPWLAFTLVFLLVVLRLLGLFYRVPATFYNLPLFCPQYYASSFLLNSLGDFLLSSLVFTYLVVFFHHYFSILSLKGKNKANLFFSGVVVFTFLFTFLFSVFINYLLSGLILDSKISFNINNIFELSGYSLIGFGIIGLLLFSFYLICDGAIRLIQKTHFSAGQISILFLITQGLFLVILLWLRDNEIFKDYGVTSFLLANCVIIFISYVRSSSKRIFSFTRTLLVILGFSFYAAKTIADFNDIKEKDNRKLLAVKLENEHDLVAEYLFEEAASRIAGDRFIHSFLLASNQQAFPFAMNREILSKRIMQLYLNGYWGKFEIAVHCFDRFGIPVGMNYVEGETLTDFDKTISDQGMPTFSRGFYYISNTAGSAIYLGRISSVNPKDSILAGTIILKVKARFAQDEGGFPDLLLSDRIPERKDFSNYSYAKYESGRLIKQFGNYPYFLTSSGYEEKYGFSRTERFVDFNGHSHLFYHYGLSGLIIISRQNQNLVVLLTLFSYIFSFFCLLFVSLYIWYRLFKNHFRFEINFKTRIQFTVFAIVMATILLTGGGTIYYIISNYAYSQNQKVSERLSSLLVLVEDELVKNVSSQVNMNEDLVSNLARLSSYLGVDFNIYNTNGMLSYSTQPKIFDQDIIARTMNANAYYELHFRQRTQYIHYEEIGSLNFLSAYEPLRNLQNEIIAYINLPYFAKQNVLKKEISSLLVTLINIYVFLFSFAMFATFVISDRITRPLGLIQKRLGQIKLGMRTEPLEWTKKDEIGALVNEYNSMVDELHNSAELLARSERESAWREMAKQVAHEIKNPLTPMKLSVQHLQRAWREKSPNLENIMQRFSQTLIEQIESLTNIADEFSNFAKMPRASNTVLDLKSILENIVNLYAESEKIKIDFRPGPGSQMLVFADKDQLLRAFSNLFKNAVQAIPESREGLIIVTVSKSGKEYVFSIRDNGEGIPEDKIGKIFTPNFTTKTGGTGLGLAMVKNIVENAGGRIWFETTAGEGTVFYISLPEYMELN